MAVDLTNVLVIGVSTRSLFNLEIENEIFENEGVEAFRSYQLVSLSFSIQIMKAKSKVLILKLMKN